MDREVTSFGALLRRHREAAGLSQEELADRAEMSTNAIGALERGDRQRPYPITVRRLADALALAADTRLAFTAAAQRRPAPDVPCDAAPPAPTVTWSSPSDGLPGYLTPLIGRDDERLVVRHLLARPQVRLLTLTGPGGVGKTRLAVQIATDMRDDLPDGVVFVPLAPLRDAALVLPAVAQACGVHEGNLPLTQTLVNTLRDRQFLLVLDNCEQVLAAAAAVVDLLLACPRMQILATSRAAFKVRGEQEYRVPPLAVPLVTAPADKDPAQTPAMALFVARAQTAMPDFALTETNTAIVAAICRRLDGLPLAIELAAARVSLLSPPALLARLERALRLLTGGARDLPARQQTMRDTIAWSYDLLPAGEQRLFARLAVFEGGWTLDAANAVCEGKDDPAVDALDGLGVLFDHSLVGRVGERDGESRYVLLEVIREYAAEQLLSSGEAEAVRRRHAQYFLALAVQARSKLRGPEQVAWLDRLEGELDNLRAALDWAHSAGEVAFGLKLAGALGLFWNLRGYLQEGRTYLYRAIADDATAPSADIGARIWALMFELLLDFRQGAYTEATARGKEALALARDAGNRLGVCHALHNLGLIAHEQGDYAGAEAYYKEALVLRREIGDRVGIGLTLSNLGFVARETGDYAHAITYVEESIALLRGANDEWGLATALNTLADAVHDAGDLPRAEALFAESLVLARRLGYKRGIARALDALGRIALIHGDVNEAARRGAESLALYRATGVPLGIAEALELLAAVAAARGDAVRSARLFAAAATGRERIGAPLPPAAREGHAQAVALARATLDDAAWEAAWEAGEALPTEQAVDEALRLAQ